MGSEPQYPHSLGKEQKVGFVLLLLFGLMAVSLGYLQMRNNLHNPFMTAKKDSGQTVTASLDEILGDDARLQSIDTDQDGLNDYEELTFYETSPYIPDTDSDGISDYAEVQKGTDPLCPEGETCITETVDSSSTSTITTVQPQIGNGKTAFELLQEVSIPVDETAPTAAEAPALTEDDMAQLQLMAENPELIRNMLAETGQLTEQQLAEITDEQLLNIFAETLRSQASALEQQ